MTRIVSKPSATYAQNFAAIFGTDPKPKPRRARSFLVYDREKKRWVAAEDRPAVPRGVAQWPMWSDAFGVHPSQAAEAEAESIKAGIPTEFCRVTGRAKFNDRHHRKRAVEAMSPMYDLDGGYSDPQPRGDRFNGR